MIRSNWPLSVNRTPLEYRVKVIREAMRSVAVRAPKSAPQLTIAGHDKQDDYVMETRAMAFMTDLP